jgi:hypothetical protein
MAAIVLMSERICDTITDKRTACARISSAIKLGSIKLTAGDATAKRRRFVVTLDATIVG